ncbi:hypothetical protein [Clostridium sp.]|uniref:hypothetical protein n=1 Tax=Clostridium sp. TaxID=1506 RepID=UPI001A50C4C2|nr:hypothetical protein [Clostridium sp.]MBK5240257.1 hypothetical protein [Clostridium sp.]
MSLTIRKNKGITDISNDLDLIENEQLRNNLSNILNKDKGVTCEEVMQLISKKIFGRGIVKWVVEIKSKIIQNLLTA